MKRESLSRSKRPEYTKMMKQRTVLPAYQMRNVIMEKIRSNQVVVISGETGNKWIIIIIIVYVNVFD